MRKGVKTYLWSQVIKAQKMNVGHDGHLKLLLLHAPVRHHLDTVAYYIYCRRVCFYFVFVYYWTESFESFCCYKILYYKISSQNQCLNILYFAYKIKRSAITTGTGMFSIFPSM